jgi:hypothetical protein
MDQTSHWSPRMAGAMSALLCVVVSLLLLGGCQGPAALTYVVEGEPPVDAKYVPPKTPLLVLVENYRLGGGFEGDQLARYIQADLQDNKVGPLVDLDKVYHLKDSDPTAYEEMTIQQVGKAVGASQVLYVDLQKFSVDSPEGSEQLKGAIIAQVRMVDVDSGITAWPREHREGETVSAQTPYMHQDGSIDERQVRQELSQKIALQISRLFYKWTPDNGDTDDGAGPDSTQ